MGLERDGRYVISAEQEQLAKIIMEFTGLGHGSRKRDQEQAGAWVGEVLTWINERYGYRRAFVQGVKTKLRTQAQIEADRLHNERIFEMSKKRLEELEKARKMGNMDDEENGEPGVDE